jgi:hypothetical protein
MPLIRLTDAELDAVLAAARPLEPHLRDVFLQEVAGALASYVEVGPGVVARVCREAQKKFFDPPDIDGASGSKYG